MNEGNQMRFVHYGSTLGISKWPPSLSNTDDPFHFGIPDLKIDIDKLLAISILRNSRNSSMSMRD